MAYAGNDLPAALARRAVEDVRSVPATSCARRHLELGGARQLSRLASRARAGNYRSPGGVTTAPSGCGCRSG